MNTLKINEIFFSLQGETKMVGLPTVFVRLTGCPLRCQYCDTAYAFREGQRLTLDDILKQVTIYSTPYVTVTGGEPLSQPLCLDLLKRLCDQGYTVSLETSGALDISKVDSRVIKVVDIKTPGSKEESRNYYDNINAISSHDQIKFVICDRADYDWAKSVIQQYNLTDLCEVLFSPSYEQIDNHMLADWILQDRLRVRFQLQMHKYVWGDVQGR